MNILYISKLSGNLWAGPNNSVPCQIKAQSNFDNCFWYNLNEVCIKEWVDLGLKCFTLKDYPSGRLKKLPKPFDNPDLAIVEELYCFPFEPIIKDLINYNIPYIIVPRSTLTLEAQNHKKLKKKLGNFIWFNKMINGASAIQYLTVKEQTDSSCYGDLRSFVVPNGINIPETHIDGIPLDSIRATYIGRVDIYQKGFDLLLDALFQCKDQLVKAKFKLNVFGPFTEKDHKTLLDLVEKYGLSDLICFNDPVFGNDKKNVLLNTNVFIMASRFEGLPMSLIEALSYGIPCLVTKGTNMAAEIDRYNAGWTSDNDVRAFKDALLQMICSFDDYSNYSKNALILANTFSWESIAAKTHNYYKEILDEK